MKVAALLSGGKDSLLALHKTTGVVCLITAVCSNPDSYMFHTDAVNLVALQAEALGLPLITFKTRGVKEEELTDLKNALIKAKNDYNIEGVVSGAFASNYQKNRVDSICNDLSLVSIAPLWHGDAREFLNELSRDFKVIIVKVSAEGLDESWIGRQVDTEFIKDVFKLNINPMGEGGEYDSLVLRAPLFKKEIKIRKAIKDWDGVTGHYLITEVVLE